MKRIINVLQTKMVANCYAQAMIQVWTRHLGQYSVRIFGILKKTRFGISFWYWNYGQRLPFYVSPQRLVFISCCYVNYMCDDNFGMRYLF